MKDCYSVGRLHGGVDDVPGPDVERSHVGRHDVVHQWTDQRELDTA